MFIQILGSIILIKINSTRKLVCNTYYQFTHSIPHIYTQAQKYNQDKKNLPQICLPSWPLLLLGYVACVVTSQWLGLHWLAWQQMQEMLSKDCRWQWMLVLGWQTGSAGLDMVSVESIHGTLSFMNFFLTKYQLRKYM